MNILEQYPRERPVETSEKWPRSNFAGAIVDSTGRVILPTGTWTQCGSDAPGAVLAHIPFPAFIADRDDLKATRREAVIGIAVRFHFDVVNEMYVRSPHRVFLNVGQVPGLGRPHPVATYRAGKVRMGHGRFGAYGALLDEHEAELDEVLHLLEEAGGAWEADHGPERALRLIREAGYRVRFSEYD